MRKLLLISSLLIITQLTGCVVHRQVRYSDPGYDNYSSSSNYSNSYNSDYPRQYPEQTTYGEVEQGEIAQIVNIRTVGQTVETTRGGGAVVGAILGGIIGNQLGRGSDSSHSHSYRRGNHYRHYEHNDGGGRAAATVGGAIIGGMIGNEMDRGSTETRMQTEVTIRMQDGRTHAIYLTNGAPFRVGDRIRVRYVGGRWIMM